jgi:hypothetical protein
MAFETTTPQAGVGEGIGVQRMDGALANGPRLGQSPAKVAGRGGAAAHKVDQRIRRRFEARNEVKLFASVRA